MSKKSRTAPKPPPISYTDLVSQAKETVQQAITALQRSIATMAAKCEADYNSKDGSHLAYLTGYATQALEAVRKLDAQERKQDAALTPTEVAQLVREYVADMTADDREALRQRLDELAASERLLAH